MYEGVRFHSLAAIIQFHFNWLSYFGVYANLVARPPLTSPSGELLLLVSGVVYVIAIGMLPPRSPATKCWMPFLCLLQEHHHGASSDPGNVGTATADAGGAVNYVGAAAPLSFITLERYKPQDTPGSGLWSNNRSATGAADPFIAQRWQQRWRQEQQSERRRVQALEALHTHMRYGEYKKFMTVFRRMLSNREASSVTDGAGLAAFRGHARAPSRRQIFCLETACILLEASYQAYFNLRSRRSSNALHPPKQETKLSRSTSAYAADIQSLLGTRRTSLNPFDEPEEVLSNPFDEPGGKSFNPFDEPENGDDISTNLLQPGPAPVPASVPAPVPAPVPIPAQAPAPTPGPAPGHEQTMQALSDYRSSSASFSSSPAPAPHRVDLENNGGSESLHEQQQDGPELNLSGMHLQLQRAFACSQLNTFGYLAQENIDRDDSGGGGGGGRKRMEGDVAAERGGTGGVGGGRLVVSFRGSTAENYATDLKVSLIPLPTMVRKRAYFLRLIRAFARNRQQKSQQQRDRQHGQQQGRRRDQTHAQSHDSNMTLQRKIEMQRQQQHQQQHQQQQQHQEYHFSASVSTPAELVSDAFDCDEEEDDADVDDVLVGLEDSFWEGGEEKDEEGEEEAGLGGRQVLVASDAAAGANAAAGVSDAATHAPLQHDLEAPKMRDGSDYYSAVAPSDSATTAATFVVPGSNGPADKIISSLRTVGKAIPLLNQSFPRIHNGFWEAYASIREDFMAAIVEAVYNHRMDWQEQARKHCRISPFASTFSTANTTATASSPLYYGFSDPPAGSGINSTATASSPLYYGFSDPLAGSGINSTAVPHYEQQRRHGEGGGHQDEDQLPLLPTCDLKITSVTRTVPSPSPLKTVAADGHRLPPSSNRQNLHPPLLQPPPQSAANSILAEMPPCASPLDVFFCGHSLGAAIASLAALELAVNLPVMLEALAAEECFYVPQAEGQRNLHYSLLSPLPRLALYTYGSPRIGNHAFVHYVERMVKTVYRVRVNGDLVTMMPKFAGFYRHLGTEVFVDEEENGNIIVSPTIMEQFLLRRATGSLANHSLDKYRRCLEAGFDEEELEEYLEREYAGTLN